jgi:lysozyme
VVGVALVIALLAAGGWLAWLPEHRPGLQAGERYGVDVSAHQGRIDWEAVADDGIHFAYIKVTEGGDHVDGQYLENWSAAGMAGVDRGRYHFFTLCRSGADQARNFVNMVEEQGELPPAVDLELAGNCARRPPSATVERELRAFLDGIEGPERPAILYVGDDFADRYPLALLDEHPRWKPRFLRRPSGPWSVWQVQGLAHVEGIDGRVDLDIGS